MPIQGTFLADFDSFYDAVNKAQVEIRAFEGDANKVGASLNRMVDAFSGRRLIQDATLMAEAVERVGGAANLTEKELAQVGAKAAEAVEKMRAMGVDVPERLQALAMHAKDGASALDKMGVAVGTFIGNFAYDLLQRGISSIAGIGAAAFESAGKVNDLSQALGVSAEFLQGIDYAAKQSGTSMEVFGDAINKLNLNLAEGDKSTVNALKALGLEYETIRAMKPEDAFLAIADRVAAIADPMERVRVGTALMGKQFVELLPAIQDNLRETVAAADKMSNDTIATLAAAEDAWQALYDKVVIVTGGIIAEVLDAATKMKNAVQEMGAGGTILFGLNTVLAQVTGNYDFVAEAAAKAGTAVKDTTPPVKDAAAANREAAETLRQLEERQRAEEKAARERAAEEKKAAEEFAKWAEVFDKVTGAARPWHDVLAENDAQLNDWIQSLLRAGASVQDIAAAYQVSTTVVEANSRALKENDETLKTIGRTYNDLASLTDQYNRLVEERTLSTTERQIAEITRWADHTKGKLMERNTLTAESEAMIDAIATERIAKLTVNEDTLHRHRIDNLTERAAIEANTLQTMLDAEVGTYAPAVIAAQQQKVIAAQQAAGQFVDAWTSGFQSTAHGAIESADIVAGAYTAAAQQAALSWSQAMDAVRAGQGTMSGAIPSGGPGSLVTINPYGRLGGGMGSIPHTVEWGSPEHQASIQKYFNAGRYFGPVLTRSGKQGFDTGGANVMGVDWGALGMEPMAGDFGSALNKIAFGQQGGTVNYNNTFNVNGTGQDVARQVSSELTRMMRAGRKWPAV